MPGPDSSTAWFLAQFKPNCHAIAPRNLGRQGFRTFLPMQEVTGRRHGRFVTRLRPLFPGYLFVALPADPLAFRAAGATVGISRIVGHGEAPARVPPGLVDDLMRRCDEAGRLIQPDGQPPAPGERVAVLTGPFADFVGTVEALAPERRVWVLLDVLGQQARVALPGGSVAPAP
ncbi:MAG TPA: transcriptional activator RfaH [Paracoccaceae bacterium]|nr:transcriptional activator RfaH [Paracoccaceae bacterium]HMO72516.1 transcriptional activator RfaH [Paracoccaceae bacterium]